MQKLFICLFIVFITINSAFCGLWSMITSAICKSCPSPSVVQNFNLNQYTGKWYEIYRGGYAPYESGLKCVTADYSLKSDGSVNVFNSGYYTDSGVFYGLNGSATYPNATVKSKLKVTFKPLGLFSVTGNYWVLDTDYTGYSLVYSCDVTFCFAKSETTWFLSRQKTLSNSVRDRLNSTLQGFSTIWKQLSPSDQSCQ